MPLDMTLIPGECYSYSGQYYGKVVAFERRGGGNYVEIQHLYGDGPQITRGYLADSTVRDLKKVDCATEAIKYYTEIFDIAKRRFISNKTMESLDSLLNYLNKLRNSKLSILAEEHMVDSKITMLENDYDTVMGIINAFTSEARSKLLREVYDEWVGGNLHPDSLKDLLMRRYSSGGGGGGGGGGNSSSSSAYSAASYPSSLGLTASEEETNVPGNAIGNVTENDPTANRTNLTNAVTPTGVPAVTPSRSCAGGLCTISGGRRKGYRKSRKVRKTKKTRQSIKTRKGSKQSRRRV